MGRLSRPQVAAAASGRSCRHAVAVAGTGSRAQQPLAAAAVGTIVCEAFAHAVVRAGSVRDGTARLVLRAGDNAHTGRGGEVKGGGLVTGAGDAAARPVHTLPPSPCTKVVPCGCAAPSSAALALRCCSCRGKRLSMRSRSRVHTTARAASQPCMPNANRGRDGSVAGEEVQTFGTRTQRGEGGGRRCTLPAAGVSALGPRTRSSSRDAAPVTRARTPPCDSRKCSAAPPEIPTPHPAPNDLCRCALPILTERLVGPQQQRLPAERAVDVPIAHRPLAAHFPPPLKAPAAEVVAACACAHQDSCGRGGVWDGRVRAGRRRAEAGAGSLRD